MDRVRPGRPFPLGATFDGQGTNFALFSEHAERVSVCLFDERGQETRAPLVERHANVWHGHLAGIGPGQRYGYRVYGPYAPREGHRFNVNKLLVDPYARAFQGKADYGHSLFGFIRSEGDGAEERPDPRDSAPGVPKCLVMDDRFDWGDDRPPQVAWHRTVLYELHVKGFTMLHPEVPSALRGTYAGLASPAVIAHLVSLGVTSVELMPVHESMDESSVSRRGFTNYWGYSTLGYFAPDQRFSSELSGPPGGQVREFKAMVKALHAAGLEVVLDVVYNHTCEGDQTGPTVSFRGIDNRAYYRLRRGDPASYEDFTGCGNTLNMLHPEALKLVMDSLRYWATEMHVDGFRFDLAPSLAREVEGVDGLSAFFNIIHQDPILSRVKLIAEPWDLGAGGYQVGNFPILWAEWNGRFRDTVRRTWLRSPPPLADLGYRLTGSSDLYEDDGRHPSASINFVTAHDGFTLRDLVSYANKHNEANGEENRDGTDDNASTNSGVEGETEDTEVLELRARQTRNLLCTLLLSQGVPMLSGGDEIGRTQHGNNNAYCQDNELSWVDWRLTGHEKEIFSFTRALLALRSMHPAFERRYFFRGARAAGATLKDITWLREDGEEMTAADWADPTRTTLTMLIAGDGVDALDDDGRELTDDSFLLIAHTGEEPVDFRVPWLPHRPPEWQVVIDTVSAEVPPARRPVQAGALLPVHAQSVVVLLCKKE
jgi:glycogen operon protein